MAVSFRTILLAALVATGTLLGGSGEAAQVDYFLKIDGIEGEADHKNHVGEMILIGMSSDIKNILKVRRPGLGGGKASFSDFHFVKTLDKASPVLAKACAQGQHFPEVKITARRTPDGASDDEQYYVITLQDCLISSYQLGGGTDDIPTEQLSLNFSKITWSYRPDSDQATTRSHDLKTGQSLPTPQ